MIGDFLRLFQNEVFTKAFDIFLKLWPVWVPLIALNIGLRAWLNYIQRLWIKNTGYVLFEIRLPKEQPKSPAAMEFVLNGIFEPAAVGTMIDAFWEGKLRDWFSLEIVSQGGEVRFFIWSLPRWKKIIEARVYAQYPGAEVVEAKDYALDLQYDPEKYSYTTVNTELTKPDAYPIKTYIDYELDKKKGDEQEEIVDPLTPLIEYFGTLRPGELAVIQILIQAHRKEGLLDAKIIAKPDWKGGIKDEIKKIIEKEALIKPEKDKPASLLSLTDAQKEAIKSMERNAGKLAFDAMIRMFYTAPKDDFDKNKLMGIIGSMRQFGTHNLNGIKPKFFPLTYPWQDWRETRKRAWQGQFVDALKRRSFFNIPHKHFQAKPYILTTEELATIFHLPGTVAATPTLQRAPSKKAEAPANLPV